ncbi:MAG: flavin reductase [Acetobacteraceae bacterium]|nr:flavin reductase [Acetobacteraceae bacterium]
MNEAHRQLAGALGRIPSGLFIVTARRDGLETGMLASWVQQCSFAPPMLSLAVKQGRYLADWLAEGAAFTVNVLERDQSDMIAHFGRGFAPGEPAFEGVDVRRPDDGGPILNEALAYLECRVAGAYPAGDHRLLVARVERGGMLNDGQPLIHVRKNGLHY